MRKRYPDEFRANAVLMAQAAGYPEVKGALSRVARKCQIPLTTLSRWVRAKNNPPPAELVSIKKEDLIDMIKAEIAAALHEMPNARPDADYRALATGIGIMVDKVQLLSGEPTQRQEYLWWRNEAIQLIRAGQMTYRATQDEFGDDLARELFQQAGVAISTVDVGEGRAGEG